MGKHIGSFRKFEFEFVAWALTINKVNVNDGVENKNKMIVLILKAIMIVLMVTAIVILITTTAARPSPPTP